MIKNSNERKFEVNLKIKMHPLKDLFSYGGETS